jgi:DNA-binding transcriptional ArsR family regulator
MTPMASGDRVPNHSTQPSARISPGNAWRRADRLGNCLREQRTEPLKELARGPLCVGELAAIMDLDIKAVSKQLRHLLAAGLLECEHRGPERIYRLSSGVSFRREGDWIHLSLTVSDLITLTVSLVDHATDLSPRPEQGQLSCCRECRAHHPPGADHSVSPSRPEIKVRAAARPPAESGS